ncbi:MAG TPA: hypothetical protein VFM63_10590 [Pyrinomonadaceae bacterium]|nr:hypothetical protein [Pyrinomonadaceae bacterium]
MRTNKPKASVVLLGMLSGALITAALAAFDFWIFTYTDDPNAFLYEYAIWLATILGAVMGFICGAVLGLFLSFTRFGPLFGAVAGAFGSVAILMLLAIKGVYPSGDERVDLTLQLFVPIGAISGCLTSLVISAIGSWREPKDHGPSGPDLPQPRRNRIIS